MVLAIVLDENLDIFGNNTDAKKMSLFNEINFKPLDNQLVCWSQVVLEKEMLIKVHMKVPQNIHGKIELKCK